MILATGQCPGPPQWPCRWQQHGVAAAFGEKGRRSPLRPPSANKHVCGAFCGAWRMMCYAVGGGWPV
eukprot:4313794-Alexandrium_andersonii.AAC.1